MDTATLNTLTMVVNNLVRRASLTEVLECATPFTRREDWKEDLCTKLLELRTPDVEAPPSLRGLQEKLRAYSANEILDAVQRV